MKLTLPVILGFAAVVRFIAAWTHVSWSHPDEWHQTVELAGMLLHRWGSWTNEVSLHLRNLTWPFVLTAPMGLAHGVWPTSPRALFVSVQLFCGLLDLARVWGMWVCLEEATQRLRITGEFLTKARRLGAALILLPAFWVADSIRPSSEHVAVIGTWIALALLIRKRWLGLGLTCVAILSLRYAMAPIAGVLLAWSAVTLLRERAYRGLSRVGAGVVIGVLLGGLPDWLIYGRPWESLWMYFLYNVSSGLAEAQFGHQGVAAYWDFLGPRWFRAQILLMIPLCIGAITMVYRGWKDRKAPPYVALILVYLAFFVSVGHKEPRFLAPIESLWMFLGWLGLVQIARSRRWNRGARGAFAAGLVLALLVNAGLFLAALWGELGRPNFNLLEVRTHLEANPNRVCAVVTAARVPPQLLRILPATAHVELDRGLSSFAQASEAPLIWGGRRPQCGVGERILLQTYKPDIGWTQAEGCRILTTGWMHLLTEERARKLNQERALSGLWLDCPAEALKRFEHPQLEHPVTHAFGRIPNLPRLEDPALVITQSNSEITYPGGCAWFCR